MATEGKESTLTLPSPTTIQMSREFDAPRELVWKALTDPQLIPQWWGQRANKTVVDKMDVRTGGAWRYREIAPDGAGHAFRGEYKELREPERIVYTFEYEPMAGHIVTDDVTLEDLGSRTRIVVTSTFASNEDRDGMLQSGMESGATESWDRLAELLATMK
jgi:uncharacterized protein YndB with AHSA1/START domain